MNPFAAVVLLSFVATPVPKDGPAKPDAAAVQGEWKVVEFIKNGEDRSKGQKSATATFKGDKMIIRHEGDKVEDTYTFTLDPKATPKAIDLKDGNDKEPRTKAIYKFEGDKLTICLGGEGRDRPKEFKSTKADSTGILVLERVKK